MNIVSIKQGNESTDVYSLVPLSVKTIHNKLITKADKQSDFVIVNLEDSPLTASQVAHYVQKNPVDRLRKLILIKDNKVILIERN